jgi:hypothetical protein
LNCEVENFKEEAEEASTGIIVGIIVVSGTGVVVVSGRFQLTFEFSAGCGTWST